MIKMKNEASSEQELKEIGYGQLMAAHAFHGTVLVDSSRTIVAYNPTAAELFANTLGEKIQKGVSFTQLFSRSKRFSDDLSRAFEGKAFTRHYQVTRHGVRFWFQCDFIPCHPDPSAQFIVIHIRDVTRRRLLHRKKKASQPKADARPASQVHADDFLHIVAHDLRNPLSRLKLIIQKEDAFCSGNLPFLMNAIQESVLQMDSIVEGLVNIINTREEAHIITKVDVKQTLDKVIREFKEEIAARSIALSVSIRDAKFTYAPPFLESIIKNLIGNAVKYAGEHAPKIEVSFGKKGSFYLLAVKDNGQGIDLKKYEKYLFQPFKRLSDDKSGLGIGLFMIKNLVERNGGKIEVESEPGKGSAFTIFLKEYTR